MATAKRLLWFLPGPAFLAMVLAVSAYRGQALTDRQWAIVQSVVASYVAVGTVRFALAGGRGIMDIKARWERALLRWLLLLAAAGSLLLFFNVIDDVAHILRLGAAPTHACAVVAVAVHLRLGWVAIFGE
jgi:hypothetical protein